MTTPITKEAILKEFTLRSAREDLTAFTTVTMPSFDPTPFHLNFFKVLDDFAHGRIKKLMIFAPPQHGKSEGSTRRLPAYLLGLNPNLKVAIVSHTASLASKFNKEIQRIMDEPDYREIFPDTVLPSGNDSYARNNTELEVVGKKGGIRSVGVEGGLTGETVDILIMDDLYKDAMDAWSPIVRGNVENWYSTVAETRLHNNSQQLIVFTRWHHEDLAGKLLAEPDNDWTVVKYPAIKEGEPDDNDPREDGEALYPQRHDIKRLTDLRNRDAFVFECMYQQNPQPKEGLLYQPFKTYTDLPTYGRRKSYVDTADLGKDYLCSISYLENKDGMYILDIIYTQAKMEVTELLVAKQLWDHQVEHSFIESNNGGRGFARQVEAKTKDLGNFRTSIEWFSQNLNKLARINTNATAVNNLIHMPEGWQMRWATFYNHVTNYSSIGRNAHDDAPDTLTGMVEKYGAGKKSLGIWALSH
ncbi:phage terminase large subunit [Pedobacter cryotolerans]|uniref:Terminase n=1 Tax=Pedobacter cryotolerans TaxID=2571270 RepID=A0A4U1C719_9SPHI|nr:phage terminase large subunit [Pedobacter cryotolerans]TKC01241.1 terminase [Pedobacter cryotolerans]